jgi:tRNA threonylcarbamoyladenosine biosynthesis protein TsaB
VITLVIDASTYVGTVALIRDARLLAESEAAMRGRDAEALMPAVAATLERAAIRQRELSRIVCGAGPGSFTSLRIAASLAKGLALGIGCPLFAVSSLALLAAQDGAPRPGPYLAVLDALRGEAYVAAYRVDGRPEVSQLMPERLARHAEVAALAAEMDAITVGPGQQRDVAPRARGALALESLIASTGPSDLASWEPRYGRKAEAQMRWEASHGQPLRHSGTRS